MIEKEFFVTNNINLNKKTAIFDIETTGFSYKSDIICIGLVRFYSKEKLRINIIVSEKKDEEIILINTFIDKILGCDRLIHYNGDSFDIPRIAKKIEKYQIKYDIKAMKSIDIYAHLKSLNKYLYNFPSLKLQDLEKYLSIERAEDFDYKNLKSHFKNVKDIIYIENLVKHNYNDLSNFVSIIHSIMTRFKPIEIYFDGSTYSLFLLSQNNNKFSFDFISKDINSRKYGRYFFSDGQELTIDGYAISFKLFIEYNFKSDIYYIKSQNKILPLIYEDKIAWNNLIYLILEKIKSI